ncbi:hypothetical protein JCM17823_27150 [Halorubrum gandharaense]
MTSDSPDGIDVLHVDDHDPFRDLVERYLEREPDITVHDADTPDRALELVSRVDCVVSDYDMPSATGLDLLAEVRDRRPDLPFLLFTGKGSEAIASEAISAGVTDYLRKGGGTDRFTMLATRIRNAVAANRAEAALRERERRLIDLHGASVALQTAATREDVAEIIVGTAEETLGHEVVTVHLRPDEQREPHRLDPVAWTDGAEAAFDGPPPAFPPGASAVRGATADGGVFVYADVSGPDAALDAETWVRSAIHAPLGDHGVLRIPDERVGAFSEDDRRTVELLSNAREGALRRLAGERAGESVSNGVGDGETPSTPDHTSTLR